MVVRLENSKSLVTLGPEFGKGGFGAVHGLPAGDYVAKTGEFCAEKVRHLMANPVVPSRSGYRYVWAQDIGIDPATGEPVCLIMPRVHDGIDTVALFSAAWLPDSFRTRVALNHIYSLIDLEAASIRRGDFPNTMVHRNGAITEIDLDSVQVNRGDVQYNCGCVKQSTIPPELIELFQSGGEHEFETTREHDAWSIAVVIWLIYFSGEHPFDFRWVGAGKRPNQMEVLKRGLWPHSSRYPEVEPRNGARSLASLNRDLADLFIRTFDGGHSERDLTTRPTLQEWESVLSKMPTGGGP